MSNHNHLLRCGAYDGAAGWTPASLPGLYATVLPALARSRGLLWQNAAKTVPAVANNDPVRVATCPFTGLDLTAPSDPLRPLLQTDGSFWWLQHDGASGLIVALAVRCPGPPFSLYFSGRPASLVNPLTAIGPEAAGFAQYRVETTGKQLLFQAGNPTGQTPGTAVSVVAADHDWGATYDGTTIAYFRDGAADGGGAYAQFGANQGPKAFGGRIDSINESWNGRLYGQVVASVVNSAADIAKIAAYQRKLHA